MTITRIINGKVEPITLTLDELLEAYEAYQHHLMLETVKSALNSGCYEEFGDLGDDAWEAAANTIAEDALELMDACEYMYDSDAATAAIKCYIRKHRLPVNAQ